MTGQRPGTEGRAGFALADGLRVALGHLRIAAMVSMLYVWTYYAMVYFVAPLQEALLPASVMSLVFLPHGVRVLSAWLYGWRSVAYLLPGAVLCNQHFGGDRAFDAMILAGTAFSLVSAPLAFLLARRVTGHAVAAVGRTGLGAIVVIGGVASILNVAGLWAVYGLSLHDTVITFVGDLCGLLVALMIVWATLRVLER